MAHQRQNQYMVNSSIHDNQHPDPSKGWDMVKATFLEKFAMKDSDLVTMAELRTFKRTGTIKEYIAAYEDLPDQAPNSINFDKAGT
ncbi:hypothetical protein DSO57_1021000 [Entomophthora muscae]|uniref:Uncharacterized protein n=1 Tax=Entomophthora muscae TaxID=34485 RepID=A0ACC2RIB2_9FUNG|nr:hypothetical protein DSO57_1021000 [Entomophthora muscae]